MCIPHATFVQLNDEGIKIPTELRYVDDETLKQVAGNLHHIARYIPDLNPVAVAGATIPIPPFIFGTKSQEYLDAATKIV